MDFGSRSRRREGQDRGRERGRSRDAVGGRTRTDRYELERTPREQSASLLAPSPSVLIRVVRQLRLSLFPIVAIPSGAPTAFHVLSPKLSPALPSAASPPATYSGHSFHPDGTFMVSLERSRVSTAGGTHSSVSAAAASASSAQDVLSIYAAGSTPSSEWAHVRSFSLPLSPAEAALVDVVGVRWSPCGRYIAAWTSVTDVRSSCALRPALFEETRFLTLLLLRSVAVTVPHIHSLAPRSPPRRLRALRLARAKSLFDRDLQAARHPPSSTGEAYGVG